MDWINIGGLVSWCDQDRTNASTVLPQLVGRLILKHMDTSGIKEFDFPYGDSVVNPGWDGRLNTTVSHPLFPHGFSGWEMGVNKEVVKKANDDYKSRKDSYEKNKPVDWDPKNTTFVFVTPRKWVGAHEWAESKKQEGYWKDVRAIDGDTLVTWLASEPAVSLWLARKSGIFSTGGGIRDIEEDWEEWAYMSDPESPLTPELVVAGRNEDVQHIHDWLARHSSVLPVQADSPKEASAFLYAALLRLEQSLSEKELSRCVVVSSENELRECIQNYEGLIIVAPFSCSAPAGRAAAKGHHVYLLKEPDGRPAPNLRVLARPSIAQVYAHLISSGMEAVKAQKLAKDSGRSITVLHRALSRKTHIQTPSWVNAEGANAILPAFLAGSWDENIDGDKEMMERLSGQTYQAFSASLVKFVGEGDVPLRKVDSVWMVKSPLDTWFLLASFLDGAGIARFPEVIQSVLCEVHPKYDLEPQQRWAAAIYNKKSAYSDWIREGLVKALVLFSVYNDKASDPALVQRTASETVKKVFSDAKTWQQWASLKDVTPLLAEASPDDFLASMRSSVESAPEVFVDLMGDGGTLFDECMHAGLLWALEGAAWSAEYLALASLNLLKLAKIDPGGKWNNRPLNSLGHIFVPGMPQTYSTPRERLEVLKMLIGLEPELIWSFAHAYFGGASMSESHHFRWREDGATRPGLSLEDREAHSEYMRGLFDELTPLACLPSNLPNSISHFTRLPSPLKEAVVQALTKLDLGEFSADQKSQIYQNLRSVLNWINSYGADEYKEYADGLMALYKRFTPANLLERFGWLLSEPWPKLPDGEPKEYEAKRKILDEAREQAAREVLDHLTLLEVFDFAKSIQYVGNLGYAIGSVVKGEEEDAQVLNAMLSQMIKHEVFIRGYVQARVKKKGTEWVDAQVQRLEGEGNLSSVSQAFLYLGLPENLKTWELVSQCGQDVETEYWKYAGGLAYGHEIDSDSTRSFAVEKLVEAKRFRHALSIAGDPKISISSAILERLLLGTLTDKAEGEKFYIGTMDEFYIGNIFRQIYQRNELSLQVIARLEWPFASIFDELKRYAPKGLAIHQLLTEDPSFFAELIGYVYKTDDGRSNDKELEEGTFKKLYTIAKDVLDSWTVIPGTGMDGKIEESQLRTWLEKAREKCTQDMRLIGCDLQIGQLLSHAPSGSDGVWPSEAVRNMIEYLRSDIIDEHVETGIFNQRGMTSRSIGDGGKQERQLAEKYGEMSRKLELKWPRTAAIMKSLKERYERSAEHEDVSAQLDDFRRG